VISPATSVGRPVGGVAVAVGAGVAVAPGPGVGVGPGLGVGVVPPPWVVSRAVSASPRELPQTMVLGLATTIFWNSGKAADVDCRYTGCR